MASGSAAVGLPAGAILLKSSDIKRLIVGHTVAGPRIDNNASSTSYHTNGTFLFSASGVVPIIKRGRYRIVSDQLCAYVCSRFARFRSGRIFMSASDGTGRTNWLPVRIVS